MAETKRATCHMCYCNCWLQATVEEGRVAKVIGDPSLPSSVGIEACVRASKGLLEQVYSPDRLDYPLKRVGERGEGKWERIGWDQALDEIATKLQSIKEQYGAEALATGFAHATGSNEDASFVGYTFSHLFGTPNHFTAPGSFCGGPASRNEQITTGWGYVFPGAAPGSTKCAIAWGANPDESFMMGPPKILARLRSEGAKTIVVDPRFTETAEQADLWLRVRPGTDGALAMAMLNVIIAEELYDKEFVATWTTGFEALKQKVKEMPPEKAEQITWVPADKIREAARMFATNRPATATYGMGITQQGKATTSISRYRVLLMLITGNVDLLGAGYETGPAYMSYYEESMFPDALTDEQAMKQLGTDRFKLLGYPGYRIYREAAEKYWKKPPCLHYLHQSTWPIISRAILTEKPYPIKAVMTNICDPFFGYPNAKLTYRAAKSPNLELLVVTELFMTPWAALADYVLPATTTFERPLLSHGYGFSNGVMAEARTLPPTAERRDDYQVYRGLADRLGIKLPTYEGSGVINYKDAIPWPETLEGYFDWMLAHAQEPVGMSFNELAEERPMVYPEVVEKKYALTDPQTGQPRGFGTISGKVELAPTTLERLGYDPFPDYEPAVDSPMANPDMVKEYPFQMFCGPRNKYYFFSQDRQCNSLRREYPYPRVQINPKDAPEIGVADGDWVYIETPVGKIRQVAMVTTEVPQGVVHVEFDWWLPELPAQEPWLAGMWEVNGNILLDDNPDKLGVWAGEPPNRATMCKVYKAPDYVKSSWMEKPAVTW